MAVLLMAEICATNYVWDTSNINVCFSHLETLPKAPITSRTISVLTLCSALITLARSIYLLTFSFPLLAVL